MQGGYLPRGRSCVCRAGETKGFYYIVLLHVWQECLERRCGPFVVNLSKQSKHWETESLRMESLAEFGLNVQKGDHFLSMDIKRGYHHFRLAPAMRDWNFSLSWSLFPMHRTSVWLESLAVVVHAVHAGVRPGTASARAASARISRQLSHFLSMLERSRPQVGVWPQTIGPLPFLVISIRG